LLQQWQQSGLSGRDFCAAERVNQSSFYAWRRELRRRDERRAATGQPMPALSSRTASPAFVQIAIDGSAPIPGAIEVVIAGGMASRLLSP
jgi:transposase-like protein